MYYTTQAEADISWEQWWGSEGAKGGRQCPSMGWRGRNGASRPQYFRKFGAKKVTSALAVLQRPLPLNVFAEPRLGEGAKPDILAAFVNIARIWVDIWRWLITVWGPLLGREELKTGGLWRRRRRFRKNFRNLKKLSRKNEIILPEKLSWYKEFKHQNDRREGIVLVFHKSHTRNIWNDPTNLLKPEDKNSTLWDPLPSPIATRRTTSPASDTPSKQHNKAKLDLTWKWCDRCRLGLPWKEFTLFVDSRTGGRSHIDPSLIYTKLHLFYVISGWEDIIMYIIATLKPLNPALYQN